jgi:hypothetical protein
MLTNRASTGHVAAFWQAFLSRRHSRAAMFWFTVPLRSAPSSVLEISQRAAIAAHLKLQY